MDQDAQRLQDGLVDVEYVAEQVLIIRTEMLECDRARSSNKEALSAMRRQAKTSRSSVLASPKPKRALVTVVKEENPVESETCLTCGDYDGRSPVLMMSRSAGVFVRFPFHATHKLLQEEEERLECRSKSLQSTLKEKTMSLSEKGGLSARIPPSLLDAFAQLKDSP